MDRRAIVRQWICVIAGGPDHGAAIPQWVDTQAMAPEPLADSSGTLCRPLLGEIVPNYYRVVLAHPRATVEEVAQAGDIVRLHDPEK
jgi:hypothetical protein